MKGKKNPGGLFSYTFRKKAAPWCILALPMAFTAWLKYYPILSAFFISLFKYDPINPPGKFVGLSNYMGCLEKHLYLSAASAGHVFFHSPDPGTFLKRADPAPEMPYHPLHPSGPHSHLRKRHYMEVDLASGLRRC